MKPYMFTDDGILSIHDPETGKLWYNQLWNEEGYLVSVSHTGGGVSQWVHPQGGVMLHEGAHVYAGGPENRYLYLRNDHTGRCWNPGVAPLVEPVEDYRAEHAPGFSRIAASADGIRASWMLVVPPDGACEYWRLTLENTTAQPIALSAFACQTFDLGGYPRPPFFNPAITSCAGYDAELQGVACISARNPHHPKHGRVSGYLCADPVPDAHDAWSEAFTGTVGAFARPRVVLRGLDATGSTATVRGRCAVLQHKFRLAPGERRDVRYLAGLCTDLNQARSESRGHFERFDREMEAAEQGSATRYWTLRTQTPDETVNRIMNRWAEKQVCFCMIGKKAVRDNAQLAMGMLNFNLELAERTLVECLEHQYRNGSAVLGWTPVVDRLYSDPPFWLIVSICELVKEAGHRDFLGRRLRYLDGGDGTVYEHLQRAEAWLDSRRGPHGLPLILHADWNDALNIQDKQAESVFMAMAYAWALAEIIGLADYQGDTAYARQCRERRAALAAAINRHAWNGDYYLRALCAAGNVGDRNAHNPDAGGQIYLNPQIWAILADVVPDERLAALCRSIDSLDTDYGAALLKPPYDGFDPSVGRISAMLPGIYENGGVFNHACGFKVMADCRIGRKREALASLRKMMPNATDANQSEVNTTDPHVFCNCFLMNPSFHNKAAFSWQTGSSAWALRSFYEGILGLQRSYAGLVVNPCLPDEWPSVSARRNFRGTVYDFTYDNRGGTQVELSVDGQRIAGNLLPLFEDGAMHAVEVKLT